MVSRARSDIRINEERISFSPSRLSFVVRGSGPPRKHKVKGFTARIIYVH